MDDEFELEVGIEEDTGAPELFGRAAGGRAKYNSEGDGPPDLSIAAMSAEEAGVKGKRGFAMVNANTTRI